MGVAIVTKQLLPNKTFKIFNKINTAFYFDKFMFSIET